MVDTKSSQPAEPEAGRGHEPLAATLSDFFAPRLARGARLCVALSGGRDSVVLLHALAALVAQQAIPATLAALHVHHGLSPHADEWADFCAAACRRYGVALAVVRVSVPRASGEGLEGAARRLRHEAFAACDADWLVLAHHRDDQAETVLLNLLRGAGLAGAAGMLVERPQVRGPALVRPLLDVPRTVIDDYVQRHALRWIDDESNEDDHHRRNFLRSEILPRLDSRFPGAPRALARAAGHFAEGALLLDELAMLDRAAAEGRNGRLALVAFNALPAARARNLLRHVWAAAGHRAPDTRWIDEARRQLASAGASSELQLLTADGELHVYRGELYITPRHAAATPEVQVPDDACALNWGGGVVRFTPTSGQGLRRELFAAGSLAIRSRHGGERLQPDARRPRRSLRNLFQELAIPPWERARLPLLVQGERVLWVAGIGIDAAAACRDGEDGVLPIWEYSGAALVG